MIGGKGDKISYTPFYGLRCTDGGRGKYVPGPEFGAGNQWGWPDDECMKIKTGG